MDKKFNKILTVCTKKAHKGEADINVFDLMYETSLPYPELKDMLDKLVLESELVQNDLKTYKFIGKLNRRFEERDKINPSNEHIKNEDTYFEKPDQELVERIKKGQEQPDDAPLFVADTSVNDRTDEDELRYKALKVRIM